MEEIQSAGRRSTLAWRPAQGRTHAHISLPILLGFIRSTDLVLLLSAGVLACQAVAVLHKDQPHGVHVLAMIVAAFTAWFFLNRLHAYSWSRLRALDIQLRLIAVSLAIGAALLVGCITMAQDARLPSWLWPASWMSCAATLIAAFRILVGTLLQRWALRAQLVRRLALVGSASSALAFINRIRWHDPIPIKIVGLYADQPSECDQSLAGIPMLGGIAELIAENKRNMRDAVVVTLPAEGKDRIAAVCRRLSSLSADVYLYPDLDTVPKQRLDTIAGVPVIIMQPRPLSDWQQLQKLLFDRICSALLLVLSLPVLLLIATLIKLDSPGPILFRQTRIGFNNLPFPCLKFRTMYQHLADASADQQTTRDDHRVTTVGRWLRKWSLDELPQVLNVLLGDMSLVGPRPHAPNTKAGGKLFPDAIAEYALRHRIRPGITGWAQVNGWRGETKTIQQIEQRVLHDLYYIEHWSLLLDLKILLLTVLRGFTGPQVF